MATRAKTGLLLRSSTSLRGGEPLEVEQFAGFCSELRLEDGSAMVLEPFQRRMVADYFAGTTETLILVSKKNGKSSLLAALSLYHLVVTPDAECVIAAASRDQAAIMLKQARGFIRRSESLGRLMEVKQREIVSTVDDGRIRILAADADTADGVIPTLALVDELHRHRSADLYGVFRDGLGPRNGRMITISTAGDDDMSPLGLMRKAALEMPGLLVEGSYRYARSPDGSYAMHEWALDPTADRHDLTVVKLANPASWQTVEALRRRHDSPSMTAAQWARFACGVWMREEDSAISSTEWAACAQHYQPIPAGEAIRVGVDLGWKWDTTAIVPHHMSAEGVATVGDPVIVVPPRDGTSTLKESILAPILELAERFHVLEVVIDPAAGGEQLAQELEAHGVEVVAYSQKPAPMSLAAERLTAAIRGRTIRHPDVHDFNSQVLAASRRSTAGEAWSFVKPKSRRPIDGVVALAMVHSIAVEAFAKPPTNREVVFL
jgi:phage terminase large subunit-like protein